MVKKGDTLIEVLLAVGIFSMIAISVVAVLSSGTSSAQTSLETTLAREEIDAQAEALRYVHSAYIADKDSNNRNLPSIQLWDTITSHAITLPSGVSAQEAIVKYTPATCTNISKDSTLAKYAFVLDPSKLDSGTAAYISATTSSSKFSTASTYPRLVYNGDNGSLLSGDVGDGNFLRAEGIYIIAVADSTGGTIDIDGSTSTVASFYDFYIRTCWYGSDSETPSTISTVIRLHNSEIHASNKQVLNISYKTEEPGVSWPSQPSVKSYTTYSGKLRYTIGGENPTKDGYIFAGYKICSYDAASSDYATQLAKCKPATDEARISAANDRIFSGDKVDLEAAGEEATNIIIYPIFIQMTTVSAQVDDTAKIPYGTISLRCKIYYACASGKKDATSATITIPIGDTVIVTGNDGGGYKFLNWSGNGETYVEDNPWNFKATGSTTVTAHFTLDVTQLSGIKVLNVYPNSGNNLKGWMSSYSKGKISVTETSISNFNSKYSTFNANDYDAIVFGFWDSNGGCSSQYDLSSGATSWVKSFINSGKAVLFGHDTISGANCPGHPNFDSLASYAGFSQIGINCGWVVYDTVVVNVDSVFTSYPHDIGGRGTKLTIPFTHTLCQVVQKADNIYMKLNAIDNKNYNFYLAVNDQYNVAMIQTGHSSGQATADEQKIIANTLFYMYSVYYKKTH